MSIRHAPGSHRCALFHRRAYVLSLSADSGSRRFPATCMAFATVATFAAWHLRKRRRPAIEGALLRVCFPEYARPDLATPATFHHRSLKFRFSMVCLASLLAVPRRNPASAGRLHNSGIAPTTVGGRRLCQASRSAGNHGFDRHGRRHRQDRVHLRWRTLSWANPAP